MAAWSESRLFFIHLKDSKLIPSSVTGTAATTWNIGEIFPEAKMGIGGVAAVSLRDGLYYFFGPTRRNDTTNGNYFNYISEVPSFIPDDAFGLDSKLDDGNPSTGIIRAVVVTGSISTNFSNDATLNSCLGATSLVYNMAGTANTCRLVVKSMAN